MNPHDDAPYEPTTTHAEWGAGDPHLTVTRDGDRFTFALTADAVRIGSAVRRHRPVQRARDLGRIRDRRQRRGRTVSTRTMCSRNSAM